MACCHPGYIYINADGYYNDPDPAIGSGRVTNFDQPGVCNSCVILTNLGGGTPFAVLSPFPEPVDCPCCPVNYVYSNNQGNCFPVGISAKTGVPTVPCINCVCIPDPVFTCPTCGTEGQAVAFQFDFEKKQCEDCVPQNNTGPSCIASFIPPQYLDPIINFKLRNKNFI
jgi:hypothetical protein